MNHVFHNNCPLLELTHGFFCSCEDCASINVNDHVKLRLNCVSTCPDVVWSIEDPKLVIMHLYAQRIVAQCPKQLI